VERVTIMTTPETNGLRRTAPRLLQILRVLARHKCLGVLRGASHCPPPAEVREAFEELGLGFLKFGQVLALRRDLLPAAYIEELERLHDRLPALSFDVIRATVEAQLHAPLRELFASFHEAPLATATIAQVHEATLPDGRHVVVKVQRPGLEATIAKDIAALAYVAALGESLSLRLRALDLSAMVQEFAASLRRETDFRREARSIGRFRSALADVPDLWIPDVVAECSSGAVLTLEYSPGERVDLYAKRHPEAMPRAIGTLVELMLHSIFEDGLFHADPHSGNVFVLPDGRLCLLDFGMTGELDEPMRESLALLLEAVVNGDAQAATDAYLEIAEASDNVDRPALKADVRAVLQETQGVDLAAVSVGGAFASLLRAGSQHGVHNPGAFFLLTRAMVILESQMRELAPHFDFMGAFRAQLERLVKQHFSLARLTGKGIKLARELERLVNDAPGDTRRVLRRVAEGNLGRVQAPGVEALGDRVSRDLKRLTGAIALAALVVGGSMLEMASLGGWHGLLGDTMISTGLFGTLVISLNALRRRLGRR
jgi:ubiquinone biosynthesis protein